MKGKRNGQNDLNTSVHKCALRSGFKRNLENYRKDNPCKPKEILKPHYENRFNKVLPRLQ